MSKAYLPTLKKLMGKKVSYKLNGGRHLQGILEGFDQLMNLVVDECTEVSPSRHQNISMVVFQGNRIVEWKL